MTQNIYDNESFFQGYSRLPRSVEGLDGAPEWPTLRGMLPDLKDTRVLDLGCGFGWFCRWARQHGARAVVGIDVSQKMLHKAREMTDDGAVEYVRADLEQLELPSRAFDLVFSSLALHYVTALQRLLASVRGALAPGGTLVFSVEHPIYTAPSAPDWLVDASGISTWPLNRYLEEGPRSTDWLAKGVVKQHRMLATYLKGLLECGFRLDSIEEWGPDLAQVAAHPQWACERDRPPFLLVAARR